MPVIAQWILGGLAWALTSSVGRILTSYGLAFVISTVVIPDWVAEISSNFSAAPAFVLQMLAFFGIDKGVTIILSAYAVKFASGRIRGLMKRGGAMAGAVA